MVAQNVQPNNSGQWQPGMVYFIKGNVTQTDAFLQSNGYIEMYLNQTTDRINQDYAWTMCQYVLTSGGPIQTSMCLYKKSNYTKYRDIPYGGSGTGYVANFSSVPVGCTSYQVQTDFNGNKIFMSAGQKIYIRLD
jgi:hypothetical protein